MSFPKVEMIEFGIFEMSFFKKVVSEHSATGFDYIDVELNLSKCTNKIPLEPNLCFGIKYKLLNYEGPSLNCKVNHPEIENPEGLAFTQTVMAKKPSSDGIYVDFFLFEYKWQMIPGYWTFQILNQSTILFEKEFEIFMENSLQLEEDEDYFYDL